MRYNHFMKIEIKDKLNIKDQLIQVNPIRVKMFILNNMNEFILISAFNGYQLPGGHVEEGENFEVAVMREVQEETGIILDENEIPVPFFKIDRYTKTDDDKNKCSSIIYYFIHTNKNYELNNRNLTEHEKENNYSISCIPKDKIEEELTRVINSSPNQGSRIVAEETLHAYEILKKEVP